MRSRIDKDILANGPAFIEAIAASQEMRERYGQRPAASKGHVRNAILFGILTANERYEAAERSLSYLRQTRPEHLRDHYAIAFALKQFGIVYYNDKARYVVQFVADFDANPTPYHPLPNESCSEYRDRLYGLSILGLGYVKTSFAAYLAYGGGDVICADRHILNLATSGGYTSAMHKNTKAAIAHLQVVERLFVGLATRYEWPSASALQWAVWCEAIGEDAEHSAVSI